MFRAKNHKVRLFRITLKLGYMYELLIKRWSFAIGRERQIYDFTYMWNRKTKTNEQTLQNRNRIRDTEDKQVVARREGGREKIGKGD